MAKNKTQLQRLVFIDQQIRKGMISGSLVNCSTLAADYEVSTKTIMRDIGYLKYQRDAPIAYDEVAHGYYYTEENYKLPAISLNESDLFAICIARKALRQHENTPVYEKLLSVFDKIDRCLPEKISVSPAWVDDFFTVVPDRQTNFDPAIWETVSHALHKSVSLHITYRKPGDKAAAVRVVDPYHAMSYQGEWYMIGYCHKRRQILTFALSRIRQAITGKPFAVQQDFDAGEFVKNRFGVFGGDKEYLVKIRFAKRHAPYVEEREWHYSQKIKKNKDGSLVLSMRVTHLFEIKRWVLSWGSGVRAMQPAVLVREIADELRKSIKEYGGKC